MATLILLDVGRRFHEAVAVLGPALALPAALVICDSLAADTSVGSASRLVTLRWVCLLSAASSIVAFPPFCSS